MDEFLRACHDTVKDNEAKALAAKMGLPHVSLLQRANPDNDAHRLTINHLFGILLHTGDMRPLKALADAFGFDLVPKGSIKAESLSHALLKMNLEIADVTRAVGDALEDNHVSRQEKELINRTIEDARRSLDVIEASVKAA